MKEIKVLFKKIIQSFLIKLDPELAHSLTLKFLYLLSRCHLLKKVTINDPINLMGLTFPNKIGLAAGLDKDAECVEAWFKMGFGFVEVGTVTPRPQSGNAKPRVFRLEEHRAVINRYGFNSKGVDYLVKKLENNRFPGVVGVNIGKNKNTPIDKSFEDYEYCLNRVAQVADYVVINISSPNTPELRELQRETYLKDLLSSLVKTRDILAKSLNKKLPLCVKIAPDLTDAEIKQMAETFIECKMDGVVATNTTIDKSSVNTHLHGNETGGLSGQPVFEKSTAVVAKFHQALKGKIPIIAAGGVHDKQTYNAKLHAGADLVQIYTGLVYGAEIQDFLS